MPALRYVTSTDGVRLAVYESGPTSAAALLAVHGYPDDHSLWDGIAARLDSSMHVIRYDVRGAGASDAPTGTTAYRIEQLVDDLVTVLDHTVPAGPVHLLGHDWGSTQTWAALTDTRLRGRIAGFTSISGPSVDQAGAWLRSALRHPLAAATQAAHSYYTLLFQLPRLPEAAIHAGFLDRAVDTSHANQEHGLALYRANLFRVTRARPQTVGVPVQILAPSSDPYVRPPIALGAPEPWVPNLYQRQIPGGHWIVRDRADVVASCVQDFVALVSGAPASRELARTRRRSGAAEFANTLVLVTGAARGIGRATALEFARAGAEVLVADVDTIGAKQTVQDLTALGGAAAAYQLDVSAADQWTGFVDEIVREHGVPDIVINNAGIGVAGSALDTSVAD